MLVFIHTILVTSQIDTKAINALFYEYSIPNTPGAVVTVVKDGELVFNNGFGIANLEYNIPLTPQTPFNIASLTKQFVCFGLLLLQNEEKLTLDDDVRTFIPELHDFGNVITLRHLMSHTSGLNDQWHLLSLAGWKLDDVITHQMVLEFLYKQRTLGFLPGERYSYSNSSYTLLSEVIARVSGMTFPEFLKKYIFEPLRMNNSRVQDDYRGLINNRAYSYQKTNRGYVKSIFSTDNYGPGGIITTGEDIAKWMINFHKTTLGSRELIQLLDNQQTLNDGTKFGGALGQFYSTHMNRKIIQHTGSEAGYRSYLVRFPEEKLSICVFSNRNNADTKRLALQTADIFLKPDKKPLIPEEKEISKPFTPVKLTNRKLKSFEGKYWDFEKDYSRTIKLKNDTLRYIIHENRQFPLVPISKQKFVMLGIKDYYEIAFDSNNAISKMEILPEKGRGSVLEKYEDISYTESQLQSFQGLYFSEELNTFIKLFVKEGKLILSHQRQEDTELHPVLKDFFVSNTWYIKSIRFIRKKETISGLLVSSNRMKNVKFTKTKGVFSN